MVDCVQAARAEDMDAIAEDIEAIADDIEATSTEGVAVVVAAEAMVSVYVVAPGGEPLAVLEVGLADELVGEEEEFQSRKGGATRPGQDASICAGLGLQPGSAVSGPTMFSSTYCVPLHDSASGRLMLGTKAGQPVLGSICEHGGRC
jgi:hypothetical protein